MRTEPLTKCLEPLQQLRARLGIRYNRFKPLFPKYFYIADQTKAVLLIGVLCFAYFCVIFYTVLRTVCLNDI